VIVVAIMVGVAVVATVIVRAFIFGEPTTDAIAPANNLYHINGQYSLQPVSE
jgi:hypothetical protein